MEYTITKRPAKYCDLMAIPPPEGFTINPPEEEFESEQWFSEHARTIEKDGKIIAVFGVKEIWPGVGHCFAFIDKDAHHHQKTLLLVGREMVDKAFETFGFWRLQATVATDFDRGIRYLQKGIGFKIDGCMPQFGPDRSDHLMMSRLNDG